LGRVRGADFSGAEILVKESFSGKTFFGGKRIEFSNFWEEGVGKVDFVVIGSGRRNMVCGLLSEYGGELGVFRGKSNFGFGSFCSYSEFGGGGEAGDYRGSHGDKTGAAPDDPIEGSVFASSVDVGRLLFPLIVLEEVRVGDGVYIDMVRGTSGGSEEGVMPFIIGFVRGKEEFGFVDGFIDGESSGGPVDNWVGGS